MDPIIAVYTIKLTVRSGAPAEHIPNLTNEQVGEATAEGLAEAYLAHGNAEVEVNATTVEQTGGD